MKTKVFFGIQIIVGILLVVFGLNKFLHFIPNPPVAQEMGEYMSALYKTGYMMPFVGSVQILAGLAFVLNKYTSLMAIVIVPVMLNAVLTVGNIPSLVNSNVLFSTLDVPSVAFTFQ